MTAPERLTAALADRYRIERELGAGGMATVYLAQDLKHDRKVAIKVLRPELAAIIGAERFLSEIKPTANLQHPHILPLHDSGQADSFLFYVMPFVEGESLRDRLSREKQLPVDDAVRIATEVAGALDYAHRHGIIHRDIKPENILLHDGRALVADFGIALAATSAGSRMTETGMSLGTPHYMSPEQAMGDRELTARSDVYALGAMTYEMLLGEPPFTGPTAQSIVAKVMTEKPAPLLSRRERIPPQVEEAVLTALEKLPADRFATAAGFATALTDGQTGGRTVSRKYLPRRPSAQLPVLGALAVVAVAIGVLIGRRTGASPSASLIEWRGELLGGPRVAMNPRVSPDGQLVVFSAMVDGQTQVGVLRSQTGDWKVLTTDRTRGLTADFSWSADNSKIYYSRFFEVPKGIFSISPLGTGERLVLADAGNPSVLPDGSLLVARLNAARHLQMYRYWPGSGKLDTLPATGTLASGTDAFFQAFPDGREAAFFGRPLAQQDSTDRLYAIDLTSNRIRRLAPDDNIRPSPLAMSPDGQSVVVNYPVGNENRLVAVPRDGSSRIQVLTVLTGVVAGLDLDQDGNLYFDQGSRAADLRRYHPASRLQESWPISSLSGVQGNASILPLPDGRLLRTVSTSGGQRVVVSTPGGEEQPFMAVELKTRGPMAVLGRDRIALMLGADSNEAVAIASLATGQLETRLPGISPTGMAGSPDGKTLYYVQSKVVWAIPADGGTARKVRDGDAVAVDPEGRYLIVELIDKTTVRLFRVPLGGGPEVELAIQGDLRVAPAFLAPNAIGPDGRIALTVISPASWYWPTAILDPRTGKLEILPPGLDYDMYGGWDSQGRVVYYAQGQESSLWRFRPVTPKGRMP
jgi:sugar lactone lactonase YvrE